MGVGGEYGEGALLTRGRTLEYYNTVSASIGFQLGRPGAIGHHRVHDARKRWLASGAWTAGRWAWTGLSPLITVGARRLDRHEPDRQSHRRLHLRRKGPDV